ncbi:unnamed protein product [Adineta steineri]|uniref:UDENN domain-containing protein n=1 Tax=Adineta steineri TaxID=433720 RepID=A0A814JUG6_9BILA|nr:unnamed protein product [Adineta steineri]
MRANHSDNRLYQTYSHDPRTKNDQKDRDTISCVNLNVEDAPGLHYLSPPSNTSTNHLHVTPRRRANTAHVYTDSNGLIINGLLFDKQLFQPPQSSYVLDYSKSTKDLNRFLEAHKTPPKSSNLDLHLFKLSFIITLSEWNVDKELLIDYCPREDDKKHIIEEINYYKKFCFPELNTKQKNGGSVVNDPSTYVFTRTSSKGQAEYGYCRRITYDNNQMTKFPIVICIVSIYPYFILFDAILNELTAVYISNEYECSLLMQSFYSKPLPIPSLNSSNIICKLNNNRVFYYICPHDDRLNHDYFFTLLSSLSPNYIVYLFESMLRSKKILCYSRSLSKLTKCCLALSHLIYPFMWPYPFVSIMPSSWMQDLIDSPCPYIYGCLYETTELFSSIIEQDCLRVNLDSNTIDVGIDDGFILPLDLRQTLQSSLEYLIRFRLTKSNSTLINIAVSEACLHVFIELLHRLPDFFKRDPISIESTNDERKFSTCSNHSQNDDNENDPQSNDIQHDECKKKEGNRLGYDFRSDEFLILQPTSSYVTFLNDFIHGMIFLKFLDDYQRPDNNSKQLFLLFSQRLNERRRMTIDELSINPLIRFRQTFDLLEKHINQASKSTNPFFTKLVKKLFE